MTQEAQAGSWYMWILRMMSSLLGMILGSKFSLTKPLIFVFEYESSYYALHFRSNSVWCSTNIYVMVLQGICWMCTMHQNFIAYRSPADGRGRNAAIELCWIARHKWLNIRISELSSVRVIYESSR